MKSINILNNCFLIIGMLIIAVSLYIWIKNYKKNPPLNNSSVLTAKITRNEWIVFSVILLAALIIRLWQYGSVPGGMNQDGAMAAVDAKALAEYGTDRYGMHMPVHFTAWGYGQMSTFLSYCMVPFIKIFGLSAITARLPILIASMFALAALYFIIRKLFGIRDRKSVV